MRTLGAAIVALVIASAIAGGASCTLFQDEIPDRTCRTDSDCFRAQGERCDPMAKVCVMAPDAAPAVDAQ